MELFRAVKHARAAGARVFIIGNGGSYANAMHICNDLLLCGVRAHALDPATLTAFANDFGYESVYRRWLQVMADVGDILIALSGSGRSPNILQAVTVAENLRMQVFRIYGAELGLNMQESEEAQVRLGHDLMRSLRDDA